jgi:hypothetical protein
MGVLVVASIVMIATRSPGPPTPPENVKAVAITCDDPCTRIHPRVTVTWTGPLDGGELSGYRVLRDGESLAGAGAIDPATHLVVDESVVFGRSYVYRVIAVGDDGDSLPSRAVSAEARFPPLEAAQLSGIYDVSLKVRSARSLGAMLGIEHPVPGKRHDDHWTFDATCRPQDAACPTTWEGLDGVLRPDGLRWRGAVSGPRARCGGGTRVAAPIAFALRTVEAAADDARWEIRSFTGTVSIRFTCPGFGPSAGTLEVTGVRA